MIFFERMTSGQKLHWRLQILLISIFTFEKRFFRSISDSGIIYGQSEGIGTMKTTLFDCLILAGISASLYPAFRRPRNKTGPMTAANGLAGPKEWGKLPGDELCATGKEQTPIDIVTTRPRKTRSFLSLISTISPQN